MKINQTGESSLFAETFTRIWKSKGSGVGMVLLALIVLSYAAASMIAPCSVNEVGLADVFKTPPLKHIFGIDTMGCGLFSRLLYGGRYSLALGICAAAFSAVLGRLIGCIAGYFGDRTKTPIMRFLNIWFSLPSMLLYILTSAVLNAGLLHTVLALTTGNVPIDVHLIRGQILSERSRDYPEAAQSINCPYLSITFRHILSNVISPMIVDATMNIGMNVAMVMALSYIGLEVQPSTSEWGVMLTDTKAHILNYPHLTMFLGIVTMLTVLAISLIDDGSRDVMDPRLRSWKECSRK